MNTESNNKCECFEFRKHGNCEHLPCHQNHKECADAPVSAQKDEEIVRVAPTPHLQWENGLKDAFYGDFSTYDMIDVKYEDVKQFIHSLLLEEANKNRQLAYETGRKEVLDEIRHEQNKLIDGFSHPKDCKMCHITKENE